MKPLSVVLSLLIALSLSQLGCDSTVTESDLQKWTHNDVGLKRIKEVVVDPKQPFTTRIRALEVMVQKSFPLRVRSVLDAIVDEADRTKVAGELAKQLIKHIEKQSEWQLDAKDCVMTLQPYLAKAEFEVVQKAVAKWAFDGIDWDTEAAELKKKFASKISSGQTMDLGRYGWQTAAILISHGFAIDRMVGYLGSAKDSEATNLLLKGLRKLHGSIGAQAYQIQALADTGSPAAAAYLLEMYFNEELEQEFRTAAFNYAVDMMDKPALKEKPGLLIDKLIQVIDANNPEDRWIGAANLVRLSGLKHFDQIMAAFKDDKIYDQAQDDPQKSVMDLCLDIRDMGHSAASVGPFRKVLQTGNRIQKSIAIICLKANDGSVAKPDLKPIASAARGRNDVSVADFLGDELTLGRLAVNAIEGLDALAAVSAEHKAGKYTDEQAKTRRLLTIFELSLVGEPYELEVQRRYADWLADQATQEKQGRGGKPADGGTKDAPK